MKKQQARYSSLPKSYRVSFRFFYIIGVITIPMAIVGFVFGALWLSWRNNLMEHKTEAIVTGILALIFTDVVPCILALVAGAIMPSRKGEA